jgi:hypothetical protein
MTVLSLWKTSPQLLAQKSVKQIIAIAGNGKLLDNGETSNEFRTLIAEIPSALLSRYTADCLTDGFPESGFALQDLINEVGRRLGFAVTNGRYRGKTGEVGNDGLWVLPNRHKLIVEVKTTDAYRIDLETINGYRRNLIHCGLATEVNSSVLIVVGRTDTGDLEAQIRGSRNAWDMRLISIDALVRLMTLKESVEDPDALRRIYEILIPREFTKLDEIVDFVFSTAEDAKEAEEIPSPEQSTRPSPSDQAGSDAKFTPVAFNQLVAERVATSLGVPLLKRTRALFSSVDDTTRALCVASREYSDGTHRGYWFAFRPHQKQQLEEADSGYAAFGCGSANRIVLLPITVFAEWLDGMNQTVKGDRSYWHVQMNESDGHLGLLRKKGQPRVDLAPYTLSILSPGKSA